MGNVSAKRPSRGIVSKLISLYFFLCPIEFGLNAVLPGGSSIKYLGFVIVLIVILKNLKRPLKPRFYHIAAILWILLCFVSLVWTISSDYSILYLKMYTNITFFFIILTVIWHDGTSIKAYLLSAMYGSTMASILLLAMGTNLEGTTLTRYTLTIFGAQIDPNGAAALIANGVVIAVYFAMFGAKNKILYSIIVAINLFAILFTGSRSGLVAVAFSIGVSLIFYLKKAQHSFRYILGIFIIATLSVLVVVITNNILPATIKERLFKLENYSGGSNRILIWMTLLPYFPARSVFGYGLGSTVQLTMDIFGKPTGAHNTYLQVLMDVGIIGFVFFIAIILILLQRGIKKKRVIQLMLIIAAIVPAFFLDSIGQRNFWNGLILAAVVSNYFDLDKEGESCILVPGTVQ